MVSYQFVTLIIQNVPGAWTDLRWNLVGGDARLPGLVGLYD